jgi:hypothetical protein
MGTGTFPRVRRPGSGVNHPPPPSAEVKGRVELYLCFPYLTYSKGVADKSDYIPGDTFTQTVFAYMAASDQRTGTRIVDVKQTRCWDYDEIDGLTEGQN